jgi:hypothetical protein
MAHFEPWQTKHLAQVPATRPLALALALALACGYAVLCCAVVALCCNRRVRLALI